MYPHHCRAEEDLRSNPTDSGHSDSSEAKTPGSALALAVAMFLFSSGTVTTGRKNLHMRVTHRGAQPMDFYTLLRHRMHTDFLMRTLV